MNKRILGYIITVMLSASAVFIAVAGITYLMQHKAEVKYEKIAAKEAAKRAKEDKPKDAAQEAERRKKALIEEIIQAEKKRQQAPTDPKIYTKLGYLYEEFGDLDEAEKNFETAILLSQYGIVKPYFELADFEIRAGNFPKAEEAINRIINKKNKVIQTAKGDFFIKLGDAYSNREDYENAIAEYKTALEYYKFVKKSKPINHAIVKIVKGYDNLAGQNLKDERLDLAIKNMETSLKYRDTVIVNYKLAILYKDIDPLQAYLYMEKAFSQDPGYINFDVYEQIIIDVIGYYSDLDRPEEVKLYEYKLKMVRKYHEKYILTDKDFTIENLTTGVKKGFLGDQKIVTIKYNIKNNTLDSVNALYLQVNVIHRGRELIVDQEKLFSKKRLFSPGDVSPTMVLEYRYYIPDDKKKEKIIFNFYVTRKPEIRKTKIYTLELKE